MRPPILWVAVGFGAGLWVGLTFFEAWGVGVWGVGLPVLVGALGVAGRAPVGAALAVAAVAGTAWGAAALRERDATCVGRWAPGRGPGDRGSRAAVVRLRDPAPPGGGIVESDVRGGLCRGALRLRWPEGVPARGGTLWLVAGRWLGSADRGLLVVRRARVLDGTARGRGALRDRVATRAGTLFGSRAPLVDALVIGRRAELEPAVRERYVRSGLAHLLSISGLHVGFLAGWIAVGLSLVPLPRAGRPVAATALVFAYVWLLGFPAPATRAALMLALDAVARARQRVAAPRGTIALAALIVMFLDPWAMRSVGAWLSFAAVAGVVWAARATEGSPLPVRLLTPATAATLLTAPITAYAFGTVAPIGVVANLVAIPLGAVAVPGLVLALLASWVVPPLGALLATGAGACLALLDLVAGRAARIPGGHVIHVPGWEAAALWAGLLWVAWWLWHSPRRPWLLAARVGFVATVLAWTATFRAVALDACRCLTVFFLDVGQGDAAALRTPGARWILIDGGPRTAERDAGRRVVVPFLRRHGATSLAAVVATHGHADHVGGLPAVLDAVPARAVLEPGEPIGEAVYLEFLAAVEGSEAEWRAARAGDWVELDGVRLDVLSPDSALVAGTVDVNEHSVVVLVSYGAVRLLFAGDAGAPVEARLAGRVGDVDLLKVGHHGSRSATSDVWLAELRPEVAIISVGRRNRYGHPAPEVLEALARSGTRVLRTDRNGTITFTTSGHREEHRDIRHHD